MPYVTPSHIPLPRQLTYQARRQQGRKVHCIRRKHDKAETEQKIVSKWYSPPRPPSWSQICSSLQETQGTSSQVFRLKAKNFIIFSSPVAAPFDPETGDLKRQIVLPHTFNTRWWNRNRLATRKTSAQKGEVQGAPVHSHSEIPPNKYCGSRLTLRMWNAPWVGPSASLGVL